MQKFFEKMGKSKKKRWEKSYASKTVPSKNPIFEKKSEKKQALQKLYPQKDDKKKMRQKSYPQKTQKKIIFKKNFFKKIF